MYTIYSSTRHGVINFFRIEHDVEKLFFNSKNKKWEWNPTIIDSKIENLEEVDILEFLGAFKKLKELK